MPTPTTLIPDEQPPVVIKQTELTQSLATAELLREQLTEAQREMVKGLYPTLNSAELWATAYRANSLGFNLLNGEITSYASTNKQGKRQHVFIVGRDAKRRRGFQLAPIEYVDRQAIYRRKTADETYLRCEPWEGGELWGAICTIKRRDVEKPFTVTVPLFEYRGSEYSLSATKPDTMIQKVAESQCWSLAVPELGGVYDEDEMPQQPEARSVSAVESPKDGQKATEEQVNTIKLMAVKVGKDDDEAYADWLSTLTQGEAKAWIAENVGRV